MCAKKILDKVKSYWDYLRDKPEVIKTKITINTEDLSIRIHDAMARNRIFDVITSLTACYTGWLAFVQAITTVNENFGKWDYVSIIMLLVAVILFVLGIYALFRSFCRPGPNKLIDGIVKTLYESEEYTAIILIKAQINGVSKILVYRQENWQSYFLPYCHYEKSDTEDAIEKKVMEEIAQTLNLPETTIIVKKACDNNLFHRIKNNPAHGNVSLINFRFYSVTFTEGVSKNLFTKTHSQQFKWKSKMELRQDMGTMNNNGDVLAIIDEKSMLHNTPVAFKNETNKLNEINRSLRIIWNITNKCSYDCEICATDSGTNKKNTLSLKEKQSILLGIASINQNIESLDLSGGDPLLSEEDRTLIQQCYRTLPFTQITVTTTAEGLDKVPLSSLSETIKRCDITYDIPCEKYESCNNARDIKARPYKYNKTNWEKLKKIRESGVDLDINVHVPIHIETTNKDDVELLLKDLELIHPKSVKFIRLMPVGRLKPSSIPNDYAPKEFMKYVVDTINEKKYELDISVSCALKIEENIFNNNPSRQCPMLEEKLGIDCEGRVFACMWAAYLSKYINNPTDNPFYLGDLKEKSLYEILKEPHPKIIKLKQEYPSACPVCMEAKKDL